MRKEYRKRFIGRDAEVLFEEEENIDGTTYFTGYTREYVKVAVKSEEPLENKMIKVKIKENYNHEILLAEL